MYASSPSINRTFQIRFIKVYKLLTFQKKMTTDNIVLEDIEEKKEVQKKIIELPQAVNGEKASEEEFLNILRLVAPGTNLRTALEGIVKIGKGALIVVENEMTGEIRDGGFKLNCRFTPQKLMELSKMDGAMILSKDMKKIMYCNVLLTPDNKIPTNETGTRHKAAERSAKIARDYRLHVRILPPWRRHVCLLPKEASRW